MSRLAIAALLCCALSSGCATLGDELACTSNSPGESCREDRRFARDQHRGDVSACDGGDARACYRAATPPNGSPVMARFQYACAHGVGDACLDAAEIYRKNRTASDAEIDQLFEQSCKLGTSLGCIHLARRSSEPKRQRLYERGCDLESGLSCFEAAEFYAQKPDQSRDDLDRHEALLVKGCAAKHRPACEALGRLESR